MQKKKEEKGITLIALVITILVILILAGVTIATLTGDNGLLQKVKTAKEKNDEGKELELIKLAVSAVKVGGKGTIITLKLDNELNAYFNDEIKTMDRGNYWTYKGYKINRDGKVEKWIPEKYKEVEYIESTGTQFIDTGIEIQSGLTIECDIASKGESFVNSTIYSDEKSLYYMGWHPTHGLYYVYNNNTRQAINLAMETNRMYHIKSILKNGFQSMEVDGNVLKTSTITGDMSIKNKNFLLFGGYDQLGEKTYKMRLGNIKYFNSNDILIKNFVPCYCTATVTDIKGKECKSGIRGFYETVKGEFYTNSGTGNFNIPEE